MKTIEQSPTERAHLHFCKMYLGVTKKTSNIGCRAELGRLPIKYEIEKKILKYFSHLHNIPNTAITKQLFILSKGFSENMLSLHNSLRKLIIKYDLPEDPDSLSLYIQKSMKRINQSMINDYIKKWLDRLDSSSKLCFYKLIKHNYLPESYIDNIKNKRHCYTLSKFRLSNHDLQIERGRYTKPPTPAEKRTCPLCRTSEMKRKRNTCHIQMQIIYRKKETSCK